MNVNELELLQFMEASGMIDLDDVRFQMNIKKKEEFISQVHTYRIWQGSNGRWYTYLFDDTRPKDRRQIAKSSHDDLMATIYDHYHQKEKQKTITLEKLYPEWLDYKSLHTPSSGSIRRIDDDWKKYYANNRIVKLPLNDLTFLMLDEWIHKLVKEHSMTKSCYFNMSLIIRQALQYAVEKKLIVESPFANVKVDSKLFRKVKKKDDNTQVYQGNEVDLVIEEAFSDFEEKGSLAALAIALAFQTGVRLGELVALRFSDVEGNYLHIQRMEVKHQKKDTDGNWRPAKRLLVDHVKSDAGNRKVYLTSEALEVITLVRKTIKEEGFSDEDFMFQDRRGRITSRAVDSRIRKYCDHINITQKSTHRIRKTYISTLIDAGLNINLIRQQVGHEDERTTYHNYCFNRMNEVETEAKLEAALIRKRN